MLPLMDNQRINMDVDNCYSQMVVILLIMGVHSPIITVCMILLVVNISTHYMNDITSNVGNITLNPESLTLIVGRSKANIKQQVNIKNDRNDTKLFYSVLCFKRLFSNI